MGALWHLQRQLQGWIKKLYREGPLFQNYLANFQQSATFSPEKLARIQNTQLQKVVQHCYRFVPYYTSLFDSLRLKPEDIQTVQDLEKLPFLDKKTVLANYDRLFSAKHNKVLCRPGRTSGSTGMPAKFWRDYHTINFEHAAVWRFWKAAGDTGKRRLTLRGDIIVPVTQNKPPFWEYNNANQELLMSSYHLSYNNAQTYIEEILRFQPKVLFCYPSTGYLLAEFFQKKNVNYQFDLIITSSESLSPVTRHHMEQVFQCKVFDWYGQAERVAAICECQHSRYHIQEDYSAVELIKTPECNVNEVEVVGTHLNNFVMPLLRYRTFDRVIADNSPCACGSHFRTVQSISGRNYDYLVTPEGYRVSIINHIPRDVPNLIETQFYQERQGEVILRVLTNGRFSLQDKEKLVKNTLEHTSPQMRVVVEEVETIPRGPSGKFMSIINKMEVKSE